MQHDSKTIELGLGGGCHWCTEAVFASIDGVVSVEQGWLAASPPDDGFSEGVLIRFDPARVSLMQLIDIHLDTHSAASNHGLRHRYRSAIYCRDATLGEQANKVLARLQQQRGVELVTRVLDLRAFRLSPPRLRNYYRQDPARPFCQRHIAPKLDRIAKRYPRLYRPLEVC